MTTATPPAQYDRTTGGIRSFITRAVTNNYHGAAFDILRNAVLDANTYFNNLHRNTCTGADCASFDTAKDIRNDFGGSLGGPVIVPGLYNGRDTTFFNFTWEQVRWPRSSTSTSTVPTAAERAGDFSSILTSNVIGANPCTGTPVLGGQIFDPGSTSNAGGTPCRTAPFAGNVIPTSRLNPIALAALSYVPQPTSPDLTNKFSYRASYPTDNTTYPVRIDQNISSSDKLFASYSTRQNTLLTGGSPVLPGPAEPTAWNQNFITHYGRAGWDRTPGPTAFNHLSLGYNRTNSINKAPAIGLSANWPAQLGLTGVSGPTFPQFNIGNGIVNIGQARGDDGIANEADVFDALTMVKGRHTVTVGGEYRWIQWNNLAYDNQSGVYNFSNVETAAAGGVFGAQSGYSLASFLLGQVDNANLNVFAHYPRYTSDYWALYVQDDFQVRPRLTLNLGFRWDVDQPRKEASNFTSNFNLAIPNPGAGGRSGALQFASNCNGCDVRWAKTFYNDVAPRIGFAWSPYGTGKRAIRGGYGILYGPLFYADFGNSMNAGYAATPNPVSPDNFSPAFNLSGGFPRYQPAPILDPTIRNGQSVDYITRGFGKPPMIQPWGLQIQQQLAKDLILSIGYLGNKGQNVRSAAGFGSYNNFRPSALGLGQSVLNSTVGSATAVAAGVLSPFPGYSGTVGNALGPYPQYRRFNTDCCLENDGMSTFHALEVMLLRRFRAGLSLQLSYTWSKTLTDADSLLPGLNGGGGLYQDPFNLYLEKSISSQDIPHTFVLSYI